MSHVRTASCEDENDKEVHHPQPSKPFSPLGSIAIDVPSAEPRLVNANIFTASNPAPALYGTYAF